MNSLNDLRKITASQQAKRIGIIRKVEVGEVLVKDLMNRKFKASIGNDYQYKVGQGVIVINNVVVGTTEIDTSPKTYVV